MKTQEKKSKIHLLPIVMCLLLLLFIGCGKDNDLLDENDSEKTEQAILGKWKLNKYVSQEIPGETETYMGKEGEWAEFKSDGTGIQQWKEDDGTFDPEPFTWKVTGDKLKFNNEQSTLIKLTKEELVFKIEGIYKNDGKDIRWIDTYYLKK